MINCSPALSRLGFLVFLVGMFLLPMTSNGLGWESTDEAKLFEKGDLKGVKEFFETANYLNDTPEFIPEAYRNAISSGNFDLIKIGRRRVGKECRSRWSPYH